MNTTRIAFRTGLLMESGNSSAKACAVDAMACAHNALTAKPWPVAGLMTIGDAKVAWSEAAERWTEKGASHAWGFERPLGW